MKRFAELYESIDASTRTTEKVAAMRAYFNSEPPGDAAWALYLLSGRRLKRLVSSPKLHVWAAELAGLPMWLFQECYDAVGDLAETLSLVVPEVIAPSDVSGLDGWVRERLMPLTDLDEAGQRALILGSWARLDRSGRLVFNKVLTGAFRVGVSQELVLRALSLSCGVPVTTLAHRLMGDWKPSSEAYLRLIGPSEDGDNVSQPYPFALAHALEGDVESLGAPEYWLADWKWDGIRAQVIRRGGVSSIWSRGEELITDRFPEVQRIAESLPDGTVLDGEILAFKDGQPMRFLDLQRRIGRMTVGKKLLADVPAAFMAFDLLELDGHDLRSLPLAERLGHLDQLMVDVGTVPGFERSPQVLFSTWADLAALRDRSREQGVEGLMLKHRDSAYEGGRKRGVWWKWKVEPHTVDAVLVYAQRGSGKRASLYSDYTFAVWGDNGLVPFAKAYSGLTDAEIAAVDRFVRANTQDKFGPVRTVKPELVMELAFEGIQVSTRHKSGFAVRFPRIVRWRTDKRPEDADTLDSIRAMLGALS